MLDYPLGKYQVLLLFLFIGQCAIGQTTDAALPIASPVELDEVYEGLSQGMVNNVVEDEEGYLWVATKDGLNRYDGSSFKTFRHDPFDHNSIAENFIYGLLVDARGRLWIGTQTSGVDLFVPESGTFIHFQHDPSNLNSISSNFIGEVYEDAKGNILVQTLDAEGYSVILMGEHEELYPDLDKVSVIPIRDIYPIIHRMHAGLDHAKHLHFDHFGGLWYLNNDTIFYADANNQNLTGEMHVFPQKIVLTRDDAELREMIFSQDKKRVMCSDLDKTLFEFDFDDKIFKEFFILPEGLRFWYKQFIDRRNRLWSWTRDGKIIRIDLNEKHLDLLQPNWSHLQAESMTLHTCISVEDANGNYWIGTGGNGLLKINGKSERVKRLQFDGSPTMYGVRLFRTEKRGGIGYLDEELMKLGRSNLSANLNGSFWSEENSHLTYDSDGYFWGSGYDVSRNLTKVMKFHSASRNLDVIAEVSSESTAMFGNPIFLDANEDVWFGEKYSGNEIGLYRFEKGIGKLTKFIFPTKVGKYQYRFISDWEFEDSGKMWFGTMNGVFSFVPSSRIWQHYSANSTDLDSLSHDQVLTICSDYHEPQKYLWVGTEGGGLNRLDKNTGEVKRFNTSNGLPNDVIYGVQTDARGNLWLSTNDGLCLFNSKTFETTTFRMVDGLPSNEFNRYEYSLAENGELCFGGMAGVITFNPEDFYTAEGAKKTVINKLLLFNEPIQYNDSLALTKFGIEMPGPIEYCQDLTFQPDHDMITFGFANLDLTSPSSNKFKFKLEGLNEEWIEAGIRNEATFTDLSPGNYCLKVLGSGNSNIWNTEPTVLNFKVLSPWWGTWWFRILIFLLVVAVLYSAYKYRLDQMLRFERMRNRIAQDLHDEIGSTLSSISLFSTVLQKSSKELSPQANGLLDKINSSTNEMMESMNDIVWTIKAENDSFEHVLNRMRAFSGTCAETKGIALKFDVENSAEKLELGMDVRRNIYLIFKESLNNAVKYSECSELEVKIKLESDFLFISVKDNGKGFDLDKELSNRSSLGGNGLNGLKYRANELGANIEISSSQENGTTVELKLPLKKVKASISN